MYDIIHRLRKIRRSHPYIFPFLAFLPSVCNVPSCHSRYIHFGQYCQMCKNSQAVVSRGQYTHLWGSGQLPWAAGEYLYLLRNCLRVESLLKRSSFLRFLLLPEGCGFLQEINQSLFLYLFVKINFSNTSANSYLTQHVYHSVAFMPLLSLAKEQGYLQQKWLQIKADLFKVVLRNRSGISLYNRKF